MILLIGCRVVWRVVVERGFVVESELTLNFFLKKNQKKKLRR